MARVACLVGAGFVHEGAHGDAEALGAAVDGFADGEDLFGELEGEFQADGFEHFFAGAEVVVDGAVGDAGFFGEDVEGQVGRRAGCAGRRPTVVVGCMAHGDAHRRGREPFGAAPGNT